MSNCKEEQRLYQDERRQKIGSSSSANTLSRRRRQPRAFSALLIHVQVPSLAPVRQIDATPGTTILVLPLFSRARYRARARYRFRDVSKSIR
jgi:hypothetical protein